MKSLLAIFARIFRPIDEDAILDHVPVQSDTRKPHARKLKAAAARHGKEFKTHTKVGRCEPSRFLTELNALTEPAPSLVITPDNVAQLRKAAQ